MRIAIIDDLATCRTELRGCLALYFDKHYTGELPIVEEFKSGEEFLDRFAPETYDLIFLDQYMDGLSGLDTARKIREVEPLTALVFVTISREHAVDSYGVRASGYLVKPFDYKSFETTMELCGVEKIRSARFLRVENEKILLREILWCDQEGHYIQIHTDRRGALRFRVPFAEFWQTLAQYPQFLLCYKGCAVNLERVERMGEIDAFFLDTGGKVLFSQRDRKSIAAAYHGWLFRREREDELL